MPDRAFGLDHDRDPGSLEEGSANFEIWRAVRDLPAAQREVVVLRAVHDLTDAEIANDLAVPIGTVKSRLFRARHTLRTRLGGEPS